MYLTVVAVRAGGLIDEDMKQASKDLVRNTQIFRTRI